MSSMSLNDGRVDDNPPRRYKRPGVSRRARQVTQSSREGDNAHEVIRIDSSDGSASPPHPSSSRQQQQQQQHRLSNSQKRRRFHSKQRLDVPKQYLDLVREAVGAERKRKVAAAASTSSASPHNIIPGERMSVSSFQRPPPINISDEENVVQQQHHHPIEISDYAPTPPVQLSTTGSAEEEEGSDYDFEDVGWEETPMQVDAGEEDTLPTTRESTSPLESPTTLDIELNRPALAGQRGVSRLHRGRKVTSAQRQLRLQVHKLHLMCLISHLFMRNKWLSSQDLLEGLKPMITPGMRNLLFPSHDQNNSVQSRKFLDGLRQVMELWARRFTISKIGITKPHWGQMPDINDMDPSMDYNQFKTAIIRMVGSRDIGAQGFCALLRSVGLNVRLIASLQPLDFSFSRDDDDDDDDENQQNSLKVRKPGESEYPIYWVEVWDTARKVWVAVDPLAIKTIEIPSTKSKLEPPSNDNENTMAYVIGFKRDGSGKDVTRRYAKGYNAKTRKLRITQFPDDAEWYNQFMKLFQFPLKTEDSEIEDEYLTNREANEPIPQNVQDFKGHPYFVLERHLRQDQVLVKRVPIGKLSTTRSTSAKSNGEDIYRRKDVRTVKSSFGWYRVGRAIKQGEQPVKYYVKRRNNARKRHQDDDKDDGGGSASEEPEEAGMYMESQTELYVAPPVVDGIVPRNAYGNIDIYVPSMVPEGGVHLAYNTRILLESAKLAGVEGVVAVSGFDYNGGKGSMASPRYNGIVIAREYAQSVMAIYHGLVNLAQQEEIDRRDRLAMNRWKRFLKGVEIRARLQQEHGIESESELEPVSEGETSHQGGDDDDTGHDESSNLIDTPAIIEKLPSQKSGGGTTLRELSERRPQSVVPRARKVRQSPTKDTSSEPPITNDKDNKVSPVVGEEEKNSQPRNDNIVAPSVSNSDGDENDDESDHYLDWI